MFKISRLFYKIIKFVASFLRFYHFTIFATFFFPKNKFFKEKIPGLIFTKPSMIPDKAMRTDGGVKIQSLALIP